MKHPNVPEIEFTRQGNRYQVLNTRTGETATLYSEEQFEQWVAARSRSDAHFPVGSAIAKVASAFGVPKCAPCARREQMLNRFFPRRLKP